MEYVKCNLCGADNAKVLFYKEGYDSQDEEDDAQDQKIIWRNHSCSFFFTKTIAPTRAAMIRIEVISNG